MLGQSARVEGSAVGGAKAMVVGVTERRRSGVPAGAAPPLREALREQRQLLHERGLRAASAVHVRAFYEQGLLPPHTLRGALRDALGEERCTVLALPVEKIRGHGACKLAFHLHFAVASGPKHELTEE